MILLEKLQNLIFEKRSDFQEKEQTPFLTLFLQNVYKSLSIFFI